MKLKIQSILTFLILFLLTFNLNAVNLDTVGNGYSYINYTTKDGLPSNEVYCVFEDSKGYIWVGTDRGVAKFDGYSFEVFTTEDGLSDNVVFGIAEDSYGRIWFTTSNLTLSYYLDSEFTLYDESRLKFLVKNYCPRSTLFFDYIHINPNNLITLTNQNRGYVQIDLKTDKINNHLKNFSTDSVFVINFTHHPSTPNNLLSKEYPRYYNDSIYLNYQSSIYLLYNKERPHERPYFFTNKCGDFYFYYDRNYHEYSNKILSTRLLDVKHRLYQLDNDFLINKYNAGKTGLVYLSDTPKIFGNESLLIDIPIRLTPSTYDKNNGIWLGSLYDGMFYIPSFAIKIVKKNFNTTGILPTKKGLLFIEKDNKYYFLNSTSKIGKYQERIKLSDLYGVSSDAICLTKSLVVDEIRSWAKNNLYSYTGSYFKSIQLQDDKVLVLSVSKFLNFDKKGSGKQLNSKKYNYPSYTFEIINTDTILGTKKGILKLDNDSLIPYKLDNKVFTKRAQDIKYIKAKNILLVATIGNGLYIYKNRKLVQHFTNKNGLMSNTINQLFRENDGRVWIATNKGVNYLSLLDSNTFQMNSLFSSSKGLLSPNIQQIYLCQDSLLYLGTDKGINEININTIFKQKHSDIPILFDKVKVNDSVFSIDILTNTEFNFNENNFIFNYRALAFNKFGDLNYRYRLKGLSDNWIYSKSRSAPFLNLAPGQYNFEIQVQNDFGDWLGQDKIIKFVIEKPYWKTIWFICLIIGMILLLIGSILFYYISNIKTENTLLENQKKLSEELNTSRQKALNSQLNPHFVFNSLNSIQHYILTNKKELSSDYLSMFSKLMRYVFENSKQLFVPLSDEVEALKLYLSLEKVRHDNSFEYKIELDEKSTNELYIPSLLVQPIIENAIWHGLLPNESTDRLVEISFFQEKNKLIITVCDNGVGRAFSKQKSKIKLIKKQKSSGVDLTKQRINLLQESTGYETEFTVTDLFSTEGKPNGTLVRITIPNNLVDFV